MNADMSSKGEPVTMEEAVAPSCRFETGMLAERLTDRGREMLVVLNRLLASDATAVCDTRERLSHRPRRFPVPAIPMDRHGDRG